ncbi:hypothetical protein BBJ28_00009629 [Nothophytophthora sp. Chile5]|nr:hypothetical protein BBJ28_00009629 [Nothophytophthora sp. Chile5]
MNLKKLIASIALASTVMVALATADASVAVQNGATVLDSRDLNAGAGAVETKRHLLFSGHPEGSTTVPPSTTRPPRTTAPYTTTDPYWTTAPYATTAPPTTTAPYATTAPPTTTAPYATTRPPTTTAPYATTAPPTTPCPAKDPDTSTLPKTTPPKHSEKPAHKHKHKHPTHKPHTVAPAKKLRTHGHYEEGPSKNRWISALKNPIHPALFPISRFIFGSGDSPVGELCPVKGDVAVESCLETLSCWTGDNTCVAPVDAVCSKIKTGAWGCVFGSKSEATPAPTTTTPCPSTSSPHTSPPKSGVQTTTPSTTAPPTQQQQQQQQEEDSSTAQTITTASFAATTTATAAGSASLGAGAVAAIVVGVAAVLALAGFGVYKHRKRAIDRRLSPSFDRSTRGELWPILDRPSEIFMLFGQQLKRSRSLLAFIPNAHFRFGSIRQQSAKNRPRMAKESRKLRLQAKGSRSRSRQRTKAMIVALGCVVAITTGLLALTGNSPIPMTWGGEGRVSRSLRGLMSNGYAKAGAAAMEGQLRRSGDYSTATTGGQSDADRDAHARPVTMEASGRVPGGAMEGQLRRSGDYSTTTTGGQSDADRDAHARPVTMEASGRVPGGAMEGQLRRSGDYSTTTTGGQSDADRDAHARPVTMEGKQLEHEGNDHV